MKTLPIALLLVLTNFVSNCPAAEKLVAGYSSISPSELTLITASKTGLFEKYGLDVSTVYLGGSTRIVQAMISGDVQIGQIGGSAVLFGKAAGIDTVFIATIINSMAAQIMSRPEIKQTSDLKGKAVGVTRRGANTDYWARFGLSHHGLVPDKDVKIIYTGGLRETYTALQAGQIAAAAMGLGNSFAQLLSRQGYNTVIDVSKLGGDFPFNGVATTRRFMQTKRPIVVSFMKAYLEAIKLNLENKVLSKKLLASHGGINDDEILEIAYDIYVNKIRAKIPYPVNRGWKTLIDFTARDNPKVKEVKAEEILDDSIVKELDESGFVKSLGLK
ncbi:MAG TPA: ABC transporter substrate-binding protein [Candidatus Limnocylindria bacterium]|nr:ABC transporter substrate-binding protein [Candidatus Limnocylindria bacterium]